MGDSDEIELTTELDGLTTITLDEATAILGEQTRMEILVALGTAWDEDRHQQKALSFSTLMESTSVSDSGRFNYHLDKLVGSFVAKTDDGYFLLNPGRNVYQMIVSGTLTERAIDKSIAADECPSCEGTVRATYRGDHFLVFTCPDCSTGHGVLPFSPRGFESRSDEQALQAAYRSFHADLRLARQTVCPACDGHMDTSVIADPGEHLASVSRGPTVASMKCTICNHYYYSDLSHVALTFESTERFFADHGRDAAVVQDWHEVTIAADESQQIVQEEPVRITLTFELDEETLDITVCEDLQVAHSTRSPL